MSDTLNIIAVAVVIVGGLALLSRVVCVQFIVSGLLLILSSVALSHGCHYREKAGPPSPPSQPNYHGRNPEVHVVEADHKNFALLLKEYESRRLEYNLNNSKENSSPSTIIPIWISFGVGISGLVLGLIWFVIRFISLYETYCD